MGVFRVWLLLIVILYSTSWKAHSLSTNLCLKRNLADAILRPDENRCNVERDFVHPSENGVSRVAEVNLTTFERAVIMLPAMNGCCIAVLFYADWCPFSRAIRPAFDTLSNAFPAVYHFAVKDSAFQPSALPEFGVHSFPSLSMYNKTTKIRYQGLRSLEGLFAFYKDVTGLKPTSNGYRVQEIPDDKPLYPDGEHWLLDDIYLLLAIAFLVLRFILLLAPKSLLGVRYYLSCTGSFHWACKILLQKVYFCATKRMQLISSSQESFKAKIQMKERGKSVLSVPRWSSSSLAAVSLAEGSTSQSGSGECGGGSGLVIARV